MSGPKYLRTYHEEKGNKAIFLALLIARAKILWCLAQLPEILDGTILPRSEVKYLRVLGSL